ncbi:MAG: hypothetical protein ACFBSF_07330 [Leptolyngbyaceae cyanobacterium]
MNTTHLLTPSGMTARIYAHDRGMTYEQAEPHIRADYERRYKDSDSTWDQVKDAARDSWGH